MAREFWRSAGLHLLSRDARGWLRVTPDYLRAYLTRPEVHPVESSCAEEVRLFEDLMADPFRAVPADRLARLADADAATNYRVVLAFRDLLARAGTVEGAYLALMRKEGIALPPVFIDQMVHVILRNALAEVADPLRLRAAELLFREQSVSTDGGRVLLADEEIVDLEARGRRETGLGQLLAETGTPMRSVELDVVGEDNKEIYWHRSDRFDTVIDLRFELPALDALARVLETWLLHLLGLSARIEPRPRIEDADWRWHIGLDREATTILNALYEGRAVAPEAQARIIGLFRMRLADDATVIERVRGHPVYLGLAMTETKRLRLKPQNLLMNLPLAPAS